MRLSIIFPCSRVNPHKKTLLSEHTRTFGYPPQYSVLVHFRASRGIQRLQRVDCPLERWNSTPPEACFASGGPCIPLEGRVSLWRHVEGCAALLSTIFFATAKGFRPHESLEHQMLSRGFAFDHTCGVKCPLQGILPSRGRKSP